MKAILFDIDGTLVRCHGAGKAALMQAAIDVFGTFGSMEKVDFQGKTDPIILHESLTMRGFDEKTIAENTEKLKEKYFSYLNKNMYEYEVTLLPGIQEILYAVYNASNVLPGLLTGNFREGARIKLHRFGLNSFFRFGAFGEDAPERNGLPLVARERIKEELGAEIDYNDMVIIGDTVHDIACARHVGAVSVAVGTGWTDREILLSRNPDYYFDDMSDTGKILDAIVNGGG